MEVTVRGISGYAYRVQAGGHELVVDQARDAGGEDRGPTPTDLFVAGLASCAAYYAGRMLSRHGVETGDVGARCEYRLSSAAPARVDRVTIELQLPGTLSEELRAAALRSARHCTVHNSLEAPPTVMITVHQEARAA